MDFSTIRKQVIIAMFSDDTLMDQLVLKGGNALNLVHRLGSRSSMDIDFSLENDFLDEDDARQRMLAALRDRFQAIGLTVFDEKFSKEPKTVRPPGNDRHTGYELAFKLIDLRPYGLEQPGIERMRREALLVGESQERVFRVQISKFEYCAGKMETELDDYTIYVYSPLMLAIEKLRAICQQMPEYRLRPHPAARARDFYDIHEIATQTRIDFEAPETLELTRNVFDAKEVPAELIPRVPDFREFHRPDWPSVVQAVSEPIKDFDHYFDFVTEKIPLLKTLWEE